ncbi:hypothetical protein C7212DRAFT_298046 [Tuber magnatum]|uniref:Uncharacterized protein n=1 Tax=Tuber magnatum TaxID=42249 RepID=A0A317SKB8_9PEZI|nr:hypothetical protein C7212DRAFT_298046 [Tuber magnatum]
MQSTPRKKGYLLDELMIDFPRYDPRDDDPSEDRTLRTLRLMRETHKQQRDRLLARHLRESEQWKKDAVASVDWDNTELVANMPGSAPTMLAYSIDRISTPEAEKALEIIPAEHRHTIVSIKQFDRPLNSNTGKTTLGSYKLAGMFADEGVLMRQRMLREEQDLRTLQEVEKAPYYEVLRRQDPERYNAKEGSHLPIKAGTGQSHQSSSRVSGARRDSGPSRTSSGSYASGAGPGIDYLGQKGGTEAVSASGASTVKSRDPRPRPSVAAPLAIQEGASATAGNQPGGLGTGPPPGHLFSESNRHWALTGPGSAPAKESAASPVPPPSPRTLNPFDRRNSSTPSQTAVICNLRNVPDDSGEAAYLKRLLMAQQQQEQQRNQQPPR